MAVQKTTIYTVNNHPIHVHEENSDKSQIALLIHGWSSSWYALSPFVPLVRDRYRVIAVDLPGYGESPRLPERTTIPAYADLLATLISELSDKPAVIIGHSMGGMIALTMTLRHPELVERMVLLNPTISGRLSVFINMFISPITIIERFSIANSIVSTFERYMLGITDRLMRPASFAARTEITDQDYVQLRADARRPGQGRVRAECFRAMLENDLRGKLAKINTPTLALWGMEDNTVPLRDASVIADELADVDLRIIPNAGHWPQFETPELTRRYVRGFLGAPIKLLEFLEST